MQSSLHKIILSFLSIKLEEKQNILKFYDPGMSTSVNSLSVNIWKIFNGYFFY